MKKIIFIILIAVASPALADQWCQWAGDQGTNCQSDSRGYIVINGYNVRTPAIAHARGWYRLVVTQPTVGENQVIGTTVWGFSDNVISKTWTVRDMTDEEIDQRAASPMPIGEYYIWKALIAKGVITQQEAAQRLPDDLKAAYLARDRLENP